MSVNQHGPCTGKIAAEIGSAELDGAEFDGVEVDGAEVDEPVLEDADPGDAALLDAFVASPVTMAK